MTNDAEALGETEVEPDLQRISRPAQHALVGAGLTSLNALTRVTEAEVSALHGMGPKALGQIRTLFHDRGSSFADQGNS